MNPLTKDQLLDVLENATLAQLRALRALRRSELRQPPDSDPNRKSNMRVVHEVLLAAKGLSTSTTSSSGPKRTITAPSIENPWSAP